MLCTRQFLPILVFLLFNPVFAQQQQSNYARHLMAQRDYFRAISEYKRLLFFADTPSARYSFAKEIGLAYRLSGKHKSSIYFYSEALKFSSTPQQQGEALIGLGMNYYQLHTLPLAKMQFRKAAEIDNSGKAQLLEGLMELEQYRWSAAESYFSKISQSAAPPALQEKATWLAGYAGKGKHLPHKKPLLAAFFSALAPGSGQVYAGHYFDGLQALGYVGTFSLATYSAYRYDRNIANSDGLLWLSATVTGLFYAANILGAYKTANFRNMRIRQNYMSEARKVIFEVTF